MDLKNTLGKDVDKLKNEVSDMKDSVKFVADKYDEHNDEMNSFKSENAWLKKSLGEQERKIEELDQYSKRQNVLFDGVIEKKDENVTELVIEKCTKLGLNVVENDIQTAHRIGKSYDDKTRPIIARFTSVGTVRNILSAVKRQYKSDQQPKQSANDGSEPKQNTSVNDVQQPVATHQGAANGNERVRAREHLTEHRGQLLRSCINMKKQSRINTCWIFNYAVFVKKSKTDTKGTKIESVQELANFLN
jgi:hypothetical protein